MVNNLTNEAKKSLQAFQDKVKSNEKLTIEENCLVSIAESLLILAEKIGKRYI